MALVSGFTLCSLIFVIFLLPRTGPTQGGSSKAQERTPKTPLQKQARLETPKPAPPPTKDLSYEEHPIQSFDKELSEVDLTLVQALITEGIGLDALKHQEVTQKQGANGTYHFQSLVLTLDHDFQEALLKRLRTYFHDWASQASLARSKTSSTRWEIRVQGLLTHELLFEPIPRARPDSGTKQPRLALVIDDIGESTDQARELYQLFGTAVTLSILPYCTHTRDIVSFGAERGLDLMLHAPMEPESYPEVDPGPGCLFVDMEKREIQETLRQNILQVPGLVGVNSHMGSRFTADSRSMDSFLRTLREQDLFFIDSLTTPKSQGTTVSARLGVPIFARDIFIDNDQNISAILFQLQKAEQLARKSGSVVAIGHPYPETLAALAQWSQRRDERVQLIRASGLLH